jgi:hypothetical protein
VLTAGGGVLFAGGGVLAAGGGVLTAGDGAATTGACRGAGIILAPDWANTAAVIAEKTSEVIKIFIT